MVGVRAAIHIVVVADLEGVWRRLVDAGGADRVLAAIELLAPFDLAQETLFAVVARRDGEVVGGRQGEIIGQADPDAEVAVVAETREKKAALALDGRVGDFKVGQRSDRQAEHLEARPLEADDLGLSVPDDLARLDAPDRRLVGLFLAGLAGGVDAVVEGRHRAVLAVGAFGREIGLVDGLDAQLVDESVAEIVGDINFVGVNLVAALFDDINVAGRHQPLGRAVIADPVGDQLVAAIFDLHAAGGCDGVGVLVVDQVVGLEQHLGIARNVLRELADILARRRQGERPGCDKADESGRAREARRPGPKPALSRHRPH